MDLITVILFLGLLLLLNTVYFWPRAFLEIGKSDPSARRSIPAKIIYYLRQGIRLKSYSPVKIQVDIIVVVLLYPATFQGQISLWNYSMAAWFVLGLIWIYQVYFTVFEKIYKHAPVLYNDWFVLKLSGRLFFYDMTRRNKLILSGVFAFGLATIFPINWLIEWSTIVPIYVARVLVAGLILIYLVFVLAGFKYVSTPRDILQSASLSFVVNIWKSIQSAFELRKLTVGKLLQFNIDPQIQLDKAKH